jgi:hypothetical protein
VAYDERERPYVVAWWSGDLPGGVIGPGISGADALGGITEDGFLKLLTVADRKLAFGIFGPQTTGTITKLTTNPHGLPSVPVWVTAVASSSWGGRVENISVDATNINIVWDTGNVSRGAWWAAIA